MWAACAAARRTAPAQQQPPPRWIGAPRALDLHEAGGVLDAVQVDGHVVVHLEPLARARCQCVRRRQLQRRSAIGCSDAPTDRRRRAAAAAALELRVPSAAVGLIWAPVAAWVITSAPAAVAGCARAAPASALTLRRELGARMWQRQALQGRAPLAARVASGAGSKARAGALGREAAADVTLVSSPAAAGPLPSSPPP